MLQTAKQAAEDFHQSLDKSLHFIMTQMRSTSVIMGEGPAPDGAGFFVAGNQEDSESYLMAGGSLMCGFETEMHTSPEGSYVVEL